MSKFGENVFKSTSINFGTKPDCTIGQSDVDTGIDSVSGATLDENGSSYSLFGGIDYNDGLRLEGFIVDFGEASLSGNSGDTFTANGTTYVFNRSGSIKSTASSWGAAGIYDFVLTKNLNGLAKAGYHFWEAETTVATTTASASITEDGSDFMFGGGLEYELSNDMSFIGMYEKYNLDEDDVMVLSGGLILKY